MSESNARSEKLQPQASALMQTLMPPQWWQFLLLLPLVGELPGVMVALVAAALPLAFASIALPKADQPLLWSMAFMELAALVHPVHAIWLNNGQWTGCVAVVFSFSFIFWCGAAVTGAWCMAECIAAVTGYIYARQNKSERRQLCKRAEILCEEWGLEFPTELSSASE